MTDRDSSVNHQINNLKVIFSFSDYLGLNNSFNEVNKKEQILEFLDTKKKDFEDDVEKKWITTWNYYLNRIKLFYRWLYNRNNDQTIEMEQGDLETPEFVRIRTKKTKRLSPYTNSELWERDDILLITKYEKHRRNKAILSLLWDLDASK
jgi:integrase/recombinase XerD